MFKKYKINSTIAFFLVAFLLFSLTLGIVAFEKSMQVKSSNSGIAPVSCNLIFTSMPDDILNQRSSGGNNFVINTFVYVMVFSLCVITHKKKSLYKNTIKEQMVVLLQ